MLNMSQINHIRDLKKKGYKISEIHEETGVDPKTIKKYLDQSDFSPEIPIAAKKPSILDPYKDKISEYLEEDRQHWRNQQHTAKRVFDRLTKEEGYTGSYDTVQKYLRDIRSDEPGKASLDLIWQPGCAQVDFGEADFYEDNDCVRRKFLTVSFPFSNDSFNQVFGGETAECVCQGLIDIFHYIGGVPNVLVFDNATGVGRRIGDTIHETELFSRFRAHYGCEVRFTSPYAGYEKGNVENKVGYNRRNLFVPVPKYHDVVEFNKELLDKHQIKAAELHYKKQELISDLFEQDKAALSPLPAKEFNACTYKQFKADGYGKICIDGKHFYSTKPQNRNQKVWVGLKAHYVEIYNTDRSLLVRHKRMYGTDRTDISDYSTMLEVLTRNPGAWKNSGVRQDTDATLRDYMDKLDRGELKTQLNLMNEISKQYGYRSALSAMSQAVRNGCIHHSDAVVLAGRISGYGIDTPSDAGPSLSVYDEAFLGKATVKGGVQA